MKVSGYYRYEESVMISESCSYSFALWMIEGSANLGMWEIKIHHKQFMVLSPFVNKDQGIIGCCNQKEY